MTTISHADGALVLARCRRDQHGFLTESDVALVASDPCTQLNVLLVRCQGGRFMAPAQDVAHFITLIERAGGDSVRDVSIPVGG